MTARQIIVDCDPGKDDAVAMLLALASPELAIERVTTVGGNVGLDRTTGNALAILELGRRPDIPVYAGCAAPLLRDLVKAEQTHGVTGIDGAGLPAPRQRPASGHGALALVEAVMAAKEPPTIAALAPLTNLAVALAIEPAIASKVREIVVMGGGFARGNKTAEAEFNIYVDPHAAAMVLRCGAPITLIPLDVTLQVWPVESWLARMAAIGTAPARATVGMWRSTPDALHDPCVMAWMLRPDLFRAEPGRVTVVTEEGPAVGRTLRHADGQPNVTLVHGVDAPGVLDLIAERIGRLA